MPRRPKTADPKEYAVQTEKLWRWLVQNAGVSASADRGNEAGRMLSPTWGGSVVSVAVARAFLKLYFVGLEREMLGYCHRFREETLDDAKRVLALMTNIAARVSRFAVRARADQYRTREVAHWPSEAGYRLEARLAGVCAAQFVIEELARTVGEMAAHSMDADTKRTVLDNLDNAALYLADAGMGWSEIADLLDAQKGSRASKADRLRKRVERARTKLKPDKRADEAGVPDAPRPKANRRRS